MKRDFKVGLEDVELIGGADNFFEGLNITEVNLRGSNKLLSLNSTFKDCLNLHTVDGNLDTLGMSSVSNLFSGCESLVAPPIIIFRGQLDIDHIFMNCKNIPTLKFENTSDLVLGNTEHAFDGCDTFDGIEFYGATSKDLIIELLKLINPDDNEGVKKYE